MKLEKLDAFQNCKIEGLSEIQGGVKVETGDWDSGVYIHTDNQYVDENGCIYKWVEGVGFFNWLTGNRHVSTYDNCSGQVIDGNI